MVALENELENHLGTFKGSWWMTLRDYLYLYKWCTHTHIYIYTYLHVYNNCVYMVHYIQIINTLGIVMIHPS